MIYVHYKNTTTFEPDLKIPNECVCFYADKTLEFKIKSYVTIQEDMRKWKWSSSFDEMFERLTFKRPNWDKKHLLRIKIVKLSVYLLISEVKNDRAVERWSECVAVLVREFERWKQGDTLTASDEITSFETAI